jgi:methylglutaconyl-CoA hydratase
MGIAAYTQLAFDAQSWRSAAWAREKGLFAEVHESISNIDDSIERLAKQLALSNPEAMKDIKRASWAGTDHWDTLLFERAAISGRLVLSDFTKNAIAQFKKK